MAKKRELKPFFVQSEKSTKNATEVAQKIVEELIMHIIARREKEELENDVNETSEQS